MSNEFYWVAVIATTVVSAARFTRLAVIDKFPPIKRLRDRYEEKTEGSGWEWLTMCSYCFSLYPTLVIFVTGLLVGVYPAYDGVADGVWTTLWWLVNGLFALTYLAAMTVARDGAVGEDD